MITYQRETWVQYRRDVEALWRDHYDEICADKRMPMSPWEDMYRSIESAGNLVCLTARSDGQLVGYLVGYFCPHPHYSTVKTFTEDAHFLHRDHRKGWAGVRLYREAEKLAKTGGAELMIIHTKANRPTGKILQRLGFSEADIVYRKAI